MPSPVTVSGFSFVRNGVHFDFPFLESIRSLLPICDEVVIAVGSGKDDTREKIASLGSPKIRILDTVWDDTLKKNGAVLAQETNKALRDCRSDWCLYLQADEVLHEEDAAKLRQDIEQAHAVPDIDGLVFPYLHFFGDYWTLNRHPGSYRREVRAIRNLPTIFSYRDAQGFRKLPNQKLHVLETQARIFHYGYVRPPQAQRKKLEFSHSLYHNGQTPKPQKSFPKEFPAQIGLEMFRGTHPRVMQARVQEAETSQPLHLKKRPPLLRVRNLSDWARYHTEKWFGWLPGEYRNYIRLSPDYHSTPKT